MLKVLLLAWLIGLTILGIGWLIAATALLRTAQ